MLLTWVGIWSRFRESEAIEPPPRTDLAVWELPGCYQITAEPWPEDSVPVAPIPEYLMLLPDSVDQWGRVNETYRARPMDDAGTEPFRWFVRADTLWVVWADGRTPGGLALREAPDGYVGRARVGGESAPIDATARVQAWKVNCGTRELENERSVRR